MSGQPGYLQEVLSVAESLIQKLDNPEAILDKYSQIVDHLQVQAPVAGHLPSCQSNQEDIPSASVDVSMEGSNRAAMSQIPINNLYQQASNSATKPAPSTSSQFSSSQHQLEDAKVQQRDSTVTRSSNDNGNQLLLAEPASMQTEHSTQVMVVGLQNENQLLRAQLHAMAARDREQRIELQRVHDGREQELEHAYKRTEEETALHHAQVQATMQQMQRTGQLQNVACAQLEAQLSAADAARAKDADHRVQVENLLRGISATMSHLVEIVESFQRDMLPTFEPPPDIFGAVEMPDCHIEDFGAVSEIRKLDRGLALLRMVMDAKVETLTLIRNKLKDENNTSKSRIEELSQQLKQLQEVQVSNRACDEALEAEKRSLRTEFFQIQELYNAEIANLQSKLKASEDSLQHSQGHKAVSSEQIRAMQDETQRLHAECAAAKKQLQEDQAMRANLAAQLAAQRQQTEQVHQEMDNLKLSQKFLTRDPGSSQSIPSDKMDLMRMVNQMLTENNKLKEQKLFLEVEANKLRREAVQVKVQAGIGEREVALAAHEQISDLNMTSKILQRNMDTANSTPALAHSSSNLMTHHQGSAMMSGSSTQGPVLQSMMEMGAFRVPASGTFSNSSVAVSAHM